MLGIISTTREKTNLSFQSCEGIEIATLHIKRINTAKMWVKKLKRIGINRVILSPQLSELRPLMDKCGLCIVWGFEIKRRMTAQFALKAAENKGISFSDLGVEIYSGGRDALQALDICSRCVRYISVIGRGSNELCEYAADKLGVSVISGKLPTQLCKNTARLYFDGRDALFSLYVGGEEVFFCDAEVILPEKYSGLCPAGCESAMAQFLLEKGRIDIGELGAGRAIHERNANVLKK